MKKPPATRPFTKTTFTVPAETWAKLKKLTGDKTSRGFAPILGEPGVRFSRDRYISELLEGELSNLTKLPINSEAADRLLATEALDHRRSEPEGYTKINVNLASSVATEFTRISTEKRIPRDLLLARFLELVVGGLQKAEVIANFPLEDAYLLDDEPYSDLHLSDEDLKERKEADLAIYAISKLKGIGMYDAERAYWKLARAERRKLRESPKVQAAIKKYRKDWQCQKETPIDLDEFLPPSQRSRKPR